MTGNVGVRLSDVLSKFDVWNTFCDLHKVKVEIDQNDEVVVVGSEKQKVQDAVSLLQKEIGKLIKQK
jgi:hypothetical protein